MAGNEKTGGLAGVSAGETALCTVGKEGAGLTYRGYDIYDLVDNASFEEVAYRAYEQGEIEGTIHVSIGQEGVATGVISALRASDKVLSHHRGHGHALAKGVDPARLMAELCARRSGVSKGKGGSMHATDVACGFLGTLAVVAGGAPMCNAYCSWNEHKGFVAHYDVDDVWALHFEGRKTWRVYEGRFEQPMEIPGFRCESLTPEQREQAKGKVLMEVDMTPGDVLYIPKGQYHDALASSEATLHLSFSVTQVTGHDFMRQLLQDLPEEPLFRQDLPHFDDIAAIEAHLGRLADRLREIITLPETAARLGQYQRQSALQNHPANFALPAREQAALYRVRALGTKLVRRGGGWLLTTGSGRETLSADEAEVARWVLGRDYFNAESLARTFDDHDAAALVPVVEKLIGAGLVQPL